MTTNATITDASVAPAAEERGFDPFAGQDTPQEQPAPAVEPEALSADARYTALETELAELKAWRTGQQAAEQKQEAEKAQAQRGQYEEKFQKDQSDLMDLARSVAVGLDEGERTRLFQAIEDASWGRVFNQPEAKQQLAQVVARAQEYEQAQATWSLIRETFGHNMSMARALELHERLMKVRDPGDRKEVARALVNSQRQQNLDNGVGQTRTEGPGNGGYSPVMNARERYLKVLREGGPLPSSEEIDRITAGYLR